MTSQTFYISSEAKPNDAYKESSHTYRRSSTSSSSLLGKRDSEGRRSNPINRSGCRYRGVTHHARTNRYESHIWDEGKQIYLGGFYSDTQAALAYDLAALKFRGEEAITNFEFYEAERATADKLSRDQVVQSLRDQSKAMNKINSSSLRVSMEPWELALSAAIHPGRLHVGVYGSEIEAARAYDRGLVAALGLESAPLLNFNIVDYLDQFSPEQVHQGVNRGLMPSMLPPNWRPPPVPMPKWHLGSLLAPRCQDRFVGYNMEGVGPDAASNNNQSAENQAQDGPVPRRTSITPRSVLDDFSDDLQEAGSPMLFDGTIADNLDIIDLCDWDESDLKNIQ